MSYLVISYFSFSDFFLLLPVFSVPFLSPILFLSSIAYPFWGKFSDHFSFDTYAIGYSFYPDPDYPSAVAANFAHIHGIAPSQICCPIRRSLHRTCRCCCCSGTLEFCPFCRASTHLAYAVSYCWSRFRFHRGDSWLVLKGDRFRWFSRCPHFGNYRIVFVFLLVAGMHQRIFGFRSVVLLNLPGN